MIGPATRSAWADEHFSSRATYARYLHVEKALVRAEADHRIVPAEAASAIEALKAEQVIDLEALDHEFERVGFPVVGLVKRIVAAIPDDLGQYAHWGATTQDIMDTALVLALRDVLERVDAHFSAIARHLEGQAAQHSGTLMAGRSQMQQAVPITFGYKVVSWLSALDRHSTRLQELRPRVLQVQFGGAVGTMAAVHPHGATIRAGLARALGLNDPGISWHTARDGLAEFVSFLGLLTSALAKIATDIALMAQTEVGELREPALAGRGTSSTMPHKRNPILSQQVLVAARAVRGLVPLMLEAIVQDHERGTGAWQSEWTLIPDACSYTLGALERMEELTAGLSVDAAQMEANIVLSRRFVYAEAVMMALATKLGRLRAHDLVETAVHRTSDGSFEDALLSTPEIAEHLARQDLARIFSGDLHREAGRAATELALRARHRLD